jgi:hypothetical protein
VSIRGLLERGEGLHPLSVALLSASPEKVFAFLI